MSYKVVNALGNEFERLCDRLARVVEASFKPDLIVGIASGGEHVARHVSSLMGCELAIVSRQRSTTKAKGFLQVQSILPKFPQSVNNLLRRLEMQQTERRFYKASNRHVSRPVHLSSLDRIKIAAAKAVLVVDDAVDTGGTFLDCLAVISTNNPTAVVKSAAIASTFERPVFVPDFVLMEHTLVRFPWAKDAVKREL